MRSDVSLPYIGIRETAAQVPLDPAGRNRTNDFCEDISELECLVPGGDLRRIELSPTRALRSFPDHR